MASCEWIINESKEANFGDKRLDKRYGDILSGLLSSPNASIPTTFQSW
ncbi:transposase DNA-binding-containing protein, partial [Legionella pneumophila serogroup 1]